MNTDFRKYVNGYHWGWKILTILGVGLLVMFIVCMCLGMDVDYIGLPVFSGIILVSLIPMWLTNSFLKKMDERSDADDIQADFENARDFRGGSLKMGNKWVFFKRKRRVVAYKDIKQVYQYVRKRYFIEVERGLKYVDANGRTRVMCQLELRGKSDDEVKQIITAIFARNPFVKIGYK